MSRNLLKFNTPSMSDILKRGYKIIGIPGGGLGKLQGVKEEQYFSKQEQQKLQNMKENYENSDYDDVGFVPSANLSKEHPTIKPFDHRSNNKHKNLLEEVYFLNEHCDCIQLMKMKKSKGNDE